MSKIITTSELQKNIGDIAKQNYKDYLIVTSRGKPKAVILPYFENNDESIEDYMENYEMWANRDVLIKRYKESLESGLSDLVI